MDVFPQGGGHFEGRGFKSCPRICIGGMKNNRPIVTAEEVGVYRGEDNTDHPIIRLSLRKPRHWNWKLTTSSSSPAVILPAVCLVDDNGNVLHDDTVGKSGVPGSDSENSILRDRNINIPVMSRKKYGHNRTSSAERYNNTRPEQEDQRERAASEVSSDLNGGPRSRRKKYNMSERKGQDDSYSSRHSDRRLGASPQGGRGSHSDHDRKRHSRPEQGGNSSQSARKRHEMSQSDVLVGSDSPSDREKKIHSMSLQGGGGSHSVRKRQEMSWSDMEVGSGRHSNRDRKRHDNMSVRSESGSHTERKRYDIFWRDRKRDYGGHSDRKRHGVSHWEMQDDSDSNTEQKKCEKFGRDRKSDSGSKRHGMSQSDIQDDSGSNTDRRDIRRHRRKPDSGYLSLRRRKGSSDGNQETPLRRARQASQDSSSSGSTRHTKWTNRKTFIIGDCLLSISGQQPHHYDQALGLLTEPPDVRLASHRHDESPTSRRPRRRQRRQSPLSTMGSNVSRHSDKGLSGRRTQSSGNLCNGNKILSKDVGRILTSCNHVGPKDRNRFCGSLPNYLDGEYAGNELDEQCCNNNNNNNASSSMKARLEEQKTGLELRLMPHLDMALHDQGYASERSPEDEHPPPLPEMPERDSFTWLTQQYPFITPESSFDVCLMKSNRGLGLSVTGGVDTSEQWPGLIRIKRLFPHQPAWQCGNLSVGDVLLAVNGVSLTGLTNYQALEVLRTTPNNVGLLVCRPPSNVFCVTVPSEPPLPPRRDPSHSISVSQAVPVVPLPLLQIEEPSGEFDIMLKKVNRSLGFTLRKEDESILGHYVRALVREPALSDGRIRPGDKIVAVNDVPLSPMSHEEAVTFLRQCGEVVKLRLYRDAAQTPIAALSPTDGDQGSLSRPRPKLRQEARDMLTDLAVRKLSPSNSSGSSHGLLHCLSGGSSPGTSPRRRRLTKTSSPDIHTLTQDKYVPKYLAASQIEDSNNSEECSWNNMFTVANAESAQVVDLSDLGEESLEMDASKPQRPQSLNLNNNSDSPRKQKYTFSGIDRTRDDTSGSPIMSSDSMVMTRDDLSRGYPMSSTSEDNGGPLMEPVSLPPLSSTSSTSTAFSYRNPAYQSAHPSCNGPRKAGDEEAMTECLSEQDISGKVHESQGDGPCGLIKWKGIVFTPQNGAKNEENESLRSEVDTENGDILIVELNRGWNSRLGFSLQADGYRTFISAIYDDSVAAKDGRLKPNDQLLTVNDESVENMTTTEIIDLLRKIRGTIEIRVHRKRGPILS